jgi:hypothetical protein
MRAYNVAMYALHNILNITSTSLPSHAEVAPRLLHMPCTCGVLEIVRSLYANVYGALKKIPCLGEGEKMVFSMDATRTMGANLDAEQQVEHVIDIGCIAGGAPVV